MQYFKVIMGHLHASEIEIDIEDGESPHLPSIDGYFPHWVESSFWMLFWQHLFGHNKEGEPFWYVTQNGALFIFATWAGSAERSKVSKRLLTYHTKQIEGAPTPCLSRNGRMMSSQELAYKRRPSLYLSVSLMNEVPALAEPVCRNAACLIAKWFMSVGFFFLLNILSPFSFLKNILGCGKAALWLLQQKADVNRRVLKLKCGRMMNIVFSVVIQRKHRSCPAYFQNGSFIY